VKKIVVVQGLFYGDEGKGSLTSYLTGKNGASLVVRYNGGSQACHNVVTNDGIHHAFQQIGSGTFDGADTYISEYMLFNPIAFANERIELQKKLGGKQPKVTISPGSVIITPYHKWMNQFREIVRGKHRHGSVGAGVGEARKGQLEGGAILFRELGDEGTVAIKLMKQYTGYMNEISGILKELGNSPVLEGLENQHTLRNIANVNIDYLVKEYRNIFLGVEQKMFAEVMDEHEVVIFEGAQGVMLDEVHGFAPYNTWTDCTYGNAFRLLDQIPGTVEIERVAVMRTYLTRHGAGPFVTEDKRLLIDEHNKESKFMGPIRYGHFDTMLGKKAINILNGVDSLALTHMDQILSGDVCVGYQFIPEEIEHLSETDVQFRLKPIYTHWGQDESVWVQNIQKEFRIPVKYLSFGPKSQDKGTLEHVSIATKS
jgi:adenylosuccinate synthase